MDEHQKPAILRKLDEAKAAVANADPGLREIYAAYGYLYLEVIEGELDDSILRNLVKITRDS